MVEVDARGLSCPEPLMMVSAALKAHPGESLKVYVTESYSRTNVEKFARNQGKSVTVNDTGHEFEIVIE